MTKNEWPSITEKSEENKEKEMSQFKIEPVQGPKNNEISFSPERGGIVTSIRLNGTEILYMNEKTFADANKNVKGGIPNLFPNSGPLPEGENNPYPNLKQHGFARTSAWKTEYMEERKFSEVFLSNEETKKAFPYNFETRMKSELNDDGSIALIQEAKNLEKDRKMPISMGLHPYFKVPDEKKKDIKFNFAGGEKLEKDFSYWSQGGTVRIDNPKLKDPNAVLRIEIPELGTLVMAVSEEYQKILIWSLPGQDFVCIEPVMRNDGGLINNPEMIKPEKIYLAKLY